MDVSIIGTGNMARGIGHRLAAGGHAVTVIGRDMEDAHVKSRAYVTSDSRQ